MTSKDIDDTSGEDEDDSPDDESVESPEEARSWILTELAEEQENGRIRKTIPKKLIEEMVAIQCRDGYGDLLTLCADHFPQLLTKLGNRELEEEDDLYDQIKKQGKYAPEVTITDLKSREPNERKATAKQLNFLRSLGVKDEKLLGSLGVRQASDAISATLDARERVLFTDQSNARGKDKGLGFGKILFIVVMVALLVMALNYYGGGQ